MEKKNTVLLTVIAVATLLVAVVGATFAYFTATTGNDDRSAGNTNVNTAKLANVKLSATAIAGSSNVVYPGTMNYVGANVTADVEGDADVQEKQYTVAYTVTGKVTLGEAFDHDVTYKLYKTNTAVTTPASCAAVKSTVVGNVTQYEQECTLDPALNDKEVTLLTGTGTVAAGETVADFTFNSTIDTDAAADDYYYVVVEYPNKAESQDTDQGKSIKAEIVSIVGNQATTK